MNSHDIIIANLLNDLKSQYHVSGIKIEFEAEGASLEEALILKEFANTAGLNLTIKIGGCQAIKDLFDAKSIGAKSVVAPMIESSYALEKFIQAINTVYSYKEQSSLNFYINIETINGYNNLNEILQTDGMEILTGIVFGRTDMVYSLGLNKETVNSDIILDYAKSINQKIKEYNLEFCIGGGITALSIPFLEQLKNLDKFETRKIIFDAKSALQIKDIQKGIQKAIEFEIMWLKYKKELYCHLHRTSDENRLKELELRYVDIL